MQPPGERVRVKKKPKLTESEKREQVRAALLKKKAFDDRALAIVERLLEPGVPDLRMVEVAASLDQRYYNDAVEERGLSCLCGYPPCHKEHIVNPAKGKFHINTQTNKIYNIEERNRFCSGFCFKASNYFRDQLDTSPLWMREREVAVVVRLYGEHLEEETAGGEVDRRENIANKSVAVEVEEVGDAIKKMQLVPKTEVDPVELVAETVQSWFTIDSYRCVEGEEKLRAALRAARVGRAAWAPAVGDPAMEQQYQARYRDLARRLDMLEVEDEEEQEEPERLPLASFAMVRREQETENLKMESFLAGRSSYTPGEDRREVEEGEVEARLPLLDRSDQLKLRRGIVLGRLTSCLPPLLRPLGLSLEQVRPGLRGLVGSFRLLPTTVTLPPAAWRLAGLLLLRLLGRRDPALAAALQGPALPGLLAPLGMEEPAALDTIAANLTGDVVSLLEKYSIQY